jgi:uncharacterized membrane protein YpjA
MKEAPGSSETSILTRATRRNNPEDIILHSHRREILKSYIYETRWTFAVQDSKPRSHWIFERDVIKIGHGSCPFIAHLTINTKKKISALCVYKMSVYPVRDEELMYGHH